MRAYTRKALALELAQIEKSKLDAAYERGRKDRERELLLARVELLERPNIRGEAYSLGFNDALDAIKLVPIDLESVLPSENERLDQCVLHSISEEPEDIQRARNSWLSGYYYLRDFIQNKLNATEKRSE